MTNEQMRLSGFSLISGCLLILTTMVLHPTGGNIEHILKIKTMAIVSHSIAILSLPCVGFGFWALSNILSTNNKFSILAFVISCFSLMAAMIAASINGIALPLFLSNDTIQGGEGQEMKVVAIYGTYINLAMDYIMLSGLALSILIWSVLIIQKTVHNKWIGYYGLLLVLLLLITALIAENLIGLHIFRMIIFGIVSWIITVGFKLLLSGKLNYRPDGR